LSNILDRTALRAREQKTQRSTPGARASIRDQRNKYKKIIYRSKTGKIDIVHDNAEEIETRHVIPASDDAFDLFHFDLAPKTALILNIPKSVPAKTIVDLINQVAVVRWIQETKKLHGKAERSSYEVTTVDESGASRIVSQFNGIRFSRLKVTALRPLLPENISDESILLWNLPRQLSDIDIVKQFVQCGPVRDWRFTRDKSTLHSQLKNIAIIWFANAASVAIALAPDVLAMVSPIQVLPARNNFEEFLRHRFDPGQLEVEARDEEEDYEVLCHAPQLPSVDDDRTHTTDGDSARDHLSLPLFAPGHAAIPNLGNTCYLSACLQALLHFPADRGLIEMLPDGQHSLIDAIKRFPALIFNEPAKAVEIVLCALSQDIPNVHAQQDASEVLSMFLNIFIQYCPTVRELIETSICQSVFTQNIGTQSESMATWVGWEILVESHSSLESAIRGFFAPETWENHTTGESGNSHPEIVKLPKSLIITLKLFKCEGERKE
jgi:hypothetical protein